MITISLCMIVKNEEAVLARCLDSVRAATAEIIIVDTGSADQTRDIALSYTEKVFDFPWIDDFAAARNFSFSKAAMDYCMWLDADDVLPPEELQKLLALKETLAPDTDAVRMLYHTAFRPDGAPSFTYYRERLIRRKAGLSWVGAIHEAIPVSGKVVTSDIAVCHRKIGPGDPERNLRIFQKLLREGKELDPRQQFYYGRELFYHRQYAAAAGVLSRFLDSRKGWIENELDACRILSKCHSALGEQEKALSALLRALSYTSPRPELCCDLGAFFLGKGDPTTAAFWYELALSRPSGEVSGAFSSPDASGYMPCIQLCVCYDRLGDHQKAWEYNQRAAAFYPDSPAVLHNRQYFEHIGVGQTSR